MRIFVFEITDWHLKLLQKLYVRPDNSYGDEPSLIYPSFNYKRPFGNSDIIEDILDITGQVEAGSECNEFHKYFAMSLFNSLPTALSICLKLLKFEAGVYIGQEQGLESIKFNLLNPEPIKIIVQNECVTQNFYDNVKWHKADYTYKEVVSKLDDIKSNNDKLIETQKNFVEQLKNQQKDLDPDIANIIGKYWWEII